MVSAAGAVGPFEVHEEGVEEDLLGLPALGPFVLVVEPVKGDDDVADRPGAALAPDPGEAAAHPQPGPVLAPAGQQP